MCTSARGLTGSKVRSIIMSTRHGTSRLRKRTRSRFKFFTTNPQTNTFKDIGRHGIFSPADRLQNALPSVPRDVEPRLSRVKLDFMLVASRLEMRFGIKFEEAKRRERCIYMTSILLHQPLFRALNISKIWSSTLFNWIDLRPLWKLAVVRTGGHK